MRQGAYTDVGTIKESNEDSLLLKSVLTPRGPVGLAVVCDGVGGLDAGDYASAFVAKRFEEWFDSELPNLMTEDAWSEANGLLAFRPRWEALIKECNQELFDYGAQRDIRLGTTFTGVLVHDGQYLLLHAGDSRCYLVADQGINLLTRDHTLMAREIARGAITPEEAAVHPYRNVVMQAVGAQEELRPDINVGCYPTGSLFLVCSDGLYHKLKPEEIWQGFAACLNQGDAQIGETCQAAVEACIRRGETDNITVACLVPQDAVSDKEDQQVEAGIGEPALQKESE